MNCGNRVIGNLLIIIAIFNSSCSYNHRSITGTYQFLREDVIEYDADDFFIKFNHDSTFICCYNHHDVLTGEYRGNYKIINNSVILDIDSLNSKSLAGMPTIWLRNNVLKANYSNRIYSLIKNNSLSGLMNDCNIDAINRKINAEYRRKSSDFDKLKSRYDKKIQSQNNNKKLTRKYYHSEFWYVKGYPPCPYMYMEYILILNNDNTFSKIYKDMGEDRGLYKEVNDTIELCLIYNIVEGKILFEYKPEMPNFQPSLESEPVHDIYDSPHYILKSDSLIEITLKEFSHHLKEITSNDSIVSIDTIRKILKPKCLP